MEKLADQTSADADESGPDLSNAWLAHILRNVLIELRSASPTEQAVTDRPIVVGLLDDTSIVPSARTYADGSSLILVPVGAMKIGHGLASCSAFLVSQAVQPVGLVRRVLQRQPDRRDLAAAAAAAVMTDIEQIRRFYEPDFAPRFAPPMAVGKRTLTALSLVQAAIRAVLVVKRTYDDLLPIPLLLDKDDEDRSQEIFQVTLAYILGHETAHVLLGHTGPELHAPDDPETARQRERDADALALALTERFAASAYSVETGVARSFARLASLIALGLNWFNDAGLMVRGSPRHPGAENRMWATLSSADNAATDDLAWIFVLIFSPIMRAGLAFVPLDTSAWNALGSDRRSLLRSPGWDLPLGDLPILDLQAGIPIERFRTYDGLSSEVVTALDYLATADAASALRELGITERKRDTLLNPERALSFFGLVQTLIESPAVQTCGSGEGERTVLAAQLAHYLSNSLRGENHDPLPRLSPRTMDETTEG
jgi:hypothetical protein